MKLKEMLCELSESVELSTDKELKEACRLIILAQDLQANECDTILCVNEFGPLFDGDIPSKSARDSLIYKGLMVKVVVKGEDGFNACNQDGYYVAKLINKLKEENK